MLVRSYLQKKWGSIKGIKIGFGKVKSNERRGGR